MRHDRRAWLLGLLLLVGSLPTLAWGDLFDTVRQAVRIDIGQQDTVGITLRGGSNLQGGVSGQTVTVLRTRGSVGGTCGAFDFAASIQQAFEEIPALLEQLGEALLANMPMLILCYASPTLCDLYKHFQALVNATIQARYAQCEQMQQAAAALGLRLRGGEIAQCLEAEQEKGTSLTVAMDRCLGEVRDVRSPDGSRKTEVHLIEETLQAAGADRLTVTLANNLVGEVVLKADGATLGATMAHPVNSVQQRYEEFRQEFVTQLDLAAATIADGQPVPVDLLQSLSWPGQPMAMVTLNALASLRGDPLRYWTYRDKLAAGLALARTGWEIHEIQEQLASAATINPNLSDAQRDTLRDQLQVLQRKMTRLQAAKDLADQYVVPVIGALLDEQRQIQRAATPIGLSAPPPQPPPLPFQGAAPWGYQP